MLNYCPHCGTKITQGANFCTSCGAPIQRTAEEKKVYQGTVNGASGAYNAPKKAVDKSDSIMSMVFGAIAPLFAVLSIIPFAGFICMGIAITFIALAKSKRNLYVRQAGQDNGFSRAGKIVSTVSIPLTCFFSMYCLIFTLVILFA